MKTPSRFAVALLATTAACMPELPPPPELHVTSPKRGLMQSSEGQVTVTGTALPGPDGSPIAKVTVNGETAKVGADGSFSVVVSTASGAMLLETMAYSEDGGKAIDARAVAIGELRQVGAVNESAVGAALSSDAFAKLSVIASEEVSKLDLMSLFPPNQPIATMGDSIANLSLTLNNLGLAGTRFALTPSNAGLQIMVEVDGLDMGATARYAGALVPDGSTTVKVSADKITVTGTLVVTPTADGKLTAKIASPKVSTVAMKLQASGLVGSIFDLLQNNLGGTVQKAISSVSERALNPGLNAALGALKGPKSLDVFGTTVALQGAFSDVQFSDAGALALLDLSAQLGEPTASYVHTPNGVPLLDPSRGVEVAVSDDLLNDMLAQVHSTGRLNLAFEKDFGLFDKAKLEMQLPPMISANTETGGVRLILGDMIVTASDGDETFVRAAINASVEVKIDEAGDKLALDIPHAHVFVNLIEDPENPSTIGPDELDASVRSGVGVQLDGLDTMLISVPVPTIKGLTLDNFSLRGDAGYMVAGAKIN